MVSVSYLCAGCVKYRAGRTVWLSVAWNWMHFPSLCSSSVHFSSERCSPKPKMDPRDAASRPIDHRAVYTQLDAECDQQATIVGDCWCYMHGPVRRRRHVLSTTGRRLALVYIALSDSRCAVDKFSKFRVCSEVPEGRTLLFKDTLLPLNTV